MRIMNHIAADKYSILEKIVMFIETKEKSATKTARASIVPIYFQLSKIIINREFKLIQKQLLKIRNIVLFVKQQNRFFIF